MTSPAVQAIADRLKAQSAQTYSGADPRGPISTIMDAPVAREKCPADKHLRWVNLKNPNMVNLRRAAGYTRVTDEEGGQVLGDEMALFVVPMAVHERAVAEQKGENARRLLSHKTEMEQLAEGTARILKDKYGISVSAERLFSSEDE